MAWTTAANTSIAISAALPSGQTSTAFAALTYTEIGEVVDLDSVVGREYNPVEHAPLKSAQRVRKKGSYSLPDATVNVAWDDADAGQILVKTASENNNIYSIKVTKQDGKLRYFTAQVSKFVENIGSVDDKVTGQITFLRQTDTITA
ncbi:MAG: hypothetical protein PGN26_14590 [Xylophilus ampelinus]